LVLVGPTEHMADQLDLMCLELREVDTGEVRGEFAVTEYQPVEAVDRLLDRRRASEFVEIRRAIAHRDLPRFPSFDLQTLIKDGIHQWTPSIRCTVVGHACPRRRTRSHRRKSTSRSGLDQTTDRGVEGGDSVSVG